MSYDEVYLMLVCTVLVRLPRGVFSCLAGLIIMAHTLAITAYFIMSPYQVACKWIANFFIHV